MAHEQILAALSGAPTTDSRPRFTYDVPESERLFPTDPKSVTLTTLRISDEIDAANVAQNGGGELAYEMIKRAVVAVDGNPVDWGKGGDSWLDKCSSKVRELLHMAYRDVNESSIAGRAAFLASRKIVVP